MIIDLHVIQNIAPANLNRDDTGSPKDTVFGGYRRARVSSQAWKRAMRTEFEQADLVPAEQLAVRTKLVIETIASGLEARGHDTGKTMAVAAYLLASMNLHTDPKSGDARKTQYLLYLGKDEIARLVDAADTHWDALASLSAPEATGAGARKTKKAAKDAIPEDVRKATAGVLKGSQAVDLALFGRMLADLPFGNVDGAAQVAHAISTNAVEMEFDFYTAVDDLQDTEEETGAGMMGTVGFNSSTFYRYANLDLAQLTENLGGDTDLVTHATEAFIRAFVTAMPTGKQTSFAAQNPPSCIVAVVRPAGRWALTNAFVRPVNGRFAAPSDQVGLSIKALGQEWSDLKTMYGADGPTSFVCVKSVYSDDAAPLGDKVESLDALVAAVHAAAAGGAA